MKIKILIWAELFSAIVLCMVSFGLSGKIFPYPFGQQVSLFDLLAVLLLNALSAAMLLHSASLCKMDTITSYILKYVDSNLHTTDSYKNTDVTVSLSIIQIENNTDLQISAKYANKIKHRLADDFDGIVLDHRVFHFLIHTD